MASALKLALVAIGIVILWAVVCQFCYLINVSELTITGYPRDALPFPSKPPYTAHLGNLSFDVTSSDISDFFADCAVTNVRIVEDKLDHKPKGFGYVEFGTPEGLKKALELSNAQFQGRNIRISVAEPRTSSYTIYKEPFPNNIYSKG